MEIISRTWTEFFLEKSPKMLQNLVDALLEFKVSLLKIMSERIRVNNNAGKKPREESVTDDHDEDIISNLPENIISHILSLLPAKDALRTSALSKIGNTSGLIPTIKTFRLKFLYKYSPSRLRTWISTALMRNVEHVEINYDHEGVVLPRCLFNCKSLTILKLRLPCTLRVPAGNWFSNLKILYLARVEILNVCVSNTPMFDFPVLESLDLDNCKWLEVKSVEIKAPALSKFNVTNYLGLPKGGNCRIKISGAKLLKFHLYGHFVESFDLSASSVFSVIVNCPFLAFDLPFVQKDGLSARLLLKRCFSLKHLKLAGCVVELLWDDDNYDEVESVPSCITCHLSKVQFRGFSGRKAQVHLADFWLTNAVGLKKMLGLYRKRSDESQTEENFWTKLKNAFKDGNFRVDSFIKNMSDFERFFG
ncbi:F-box/LRR-repeat protein At3g26922-like [Primulina tabacum]|uniref:F-box/LRR-repeat protein At3g26922-like n=1 Tax=Primulina tabacum TaxID=48773 RepID=UPI003F5ACF72